MRSDHKERLISHDSLRARERHAWALWPNVVKTVRLRARWARWSYLNEGPVCAQHADVVL